MARTDYYNDPDAPPANSVVPSTTAVVTDDQDRIVLIRRRDNDLWALPGGGMELGESIVDTAVRKVKEETGLDVEVTGLIGVYTNPHHVMAYTDGVVRQQFSLCFTTRLVGGDLLNLFGCGHVLRQLRFDCHRAPPGVDLRRGR